MLDAAQLKVEARTWVFLAVVRRDDLSELRVRARVVHRDRANRLRANVSLSRFTQSSSNKVLD